jgi:ABC-2 type transport system permease protein
MQKTWSLTRRELGAYFLSPTAWVVLAIFLLISGWFFSTITLSSRYADMRPILGNMAVLFIFLAPALTSPLWSEELKQGTDELLMTAPVATAQVVIAKYLACLLLFVSYMAVTIAYPVILEIWGSPDWNAVLTGYLGLFLMGSACLAVGFYASSLTDSQMVAAMLAFAMLLGFWVIAWAGDSLPAAWWPVLEYASLTRHYDDFAKGVIDTKHVVYFLTLIGAFLFLTTRRLESARWR